MRSYFLNASCAGALFFASGFSVSGASQQEGPTAPAAAAEAPAQRAPASPQAAGPPAVATASKSAAPTNGALVVVPTGTHIPLVLHNGISTRTAKPGDSVYFETLFPILVDGKVAIPAGSYISGEITEAKRPGHVKGRGEMMMRLTTMILPNSYVVNLNAGPSNLSSGGGEIANSEGKIVGGSNKASDVGTVIRTTEAGTGIGAGVGAASGNVARGAGIGAGVGALAGLGAVLLTRGPEAELPRGSTLEAVIERPIYLDSNRVQFTGPGQASSMAGPPNRENQRPLFDPF